MLIQDLTVTEAPAVTGPNWVPSPLVDNEVEFPVGFIDGERLYRLDTDHVTPLEEATYNPMTGELKLVFDYDRLLDVNGKWWAGRHIDAVTLDGTAFPLVIHDDAGPRDENGDYIFDRTTVFNEFTIQIGAERVANGGTLEFGFTDKEDGGGDTYYTFTLEQDPVVDEEGIYEHPEGLVFAVNAGGDEFIATNGVTYKADVFGSGNEFSTGAEIAGTENDTLYQSERWDGNGFQYEIAVENGVYDLELNFAEIWGGASRDGARVFEITVEDTTLSMPVDIFSEAGLNAALDLIGQVEVTDGALSISAQNLVQNSKISGFSLWDASGDLDEGFEFGSFSGISDAPQGNVLTFTEGDDTVTISEPADEVFLLGGNDRVNLYSEVGTVDLGDGNNTLNVIGSGTAELVIGGSGNDRVVSRSDLGTLETGGGDDVLLLTGDVELADVGDGANIVSLIGNGTIAAGSGDDELSLRGDGFVSSGLGNDTIDFKGNGLVYSGFNAAASEADNDTVDFEGTGTVLTFGGDDTVDFAGFGRVDTGFGNDTVTVNEASDDVVDTEGFGVTIETLFGDDRVIVNAEADMIRVFEGNNSVQINAHAEEVSAGSGTDLVFLSSAGSAGTIDLGGGNNVVTAFGDVGSIVTGDGFDRIESRAGAEIGSVESGGGNDLLFLQGKFDMVDAGTGNDTINLSRNGEGEVRGGDGNDNVSSGGGAVDFFGEIGDDVFRFRGPGAGSSSFDGGEGTDTLAVLDPAFWATPATQEQILESFGQQPTTANQVVLDYGDQDTLFSDLLNIEITGVENLAFG